MLLAARLDADQRVATLEAACFKAADGRAGGSADFCEGRVPVDVSALADGAAERPSLSATPPPAHACLLKAVGERVVAQT